MNSKIKNVLKNLPHSPGVYKFKNSDDQIIYIGKAKNLAKRVRSYFQKIEQHPIKTKKLLENIADLDYSIVNTELEALILETNLIKEYRPKYNILMKDDKNFAYIKITINEDYPRILVVRKVINDKAKYFGPKTAASKIHQTLNLIRKIFPYRNCNLCIEDLGPATDRFDRKRKVKVTKAGIKYPCLDLHIKRCIAPCIGKPEKLEYDLIIENIISFLEGKYQKVIETIKAQMNEAAKNKQYEKAAKLRDKILAIESLFEKQLINDANLEKLDIVNFYQQGEKAFFTIFQIREGKIIDQQNITISNSLDNEPEETLNSFLKQYYSQAINFPKEIIVSHDLAEQNILESYISNLANNKVKITKPSKGDKQKLLDLALENAKSYSKQTQAKWESSVIPDKDLALEKLAQHLNLKKIPKRIECYDISHLSGTYTTASMAVLENGYPKKDQYRHFKISLDNAGSPDDYASINQVILRRLKYIKPNLNNNDYKLVKSRKKTKKFAEVYQFKKAKQQITEIKLIQSNKAKTFVDSFNVKPKILEILIPKLLSKLKTSRLYLIIDQDKLKEFEKYAFQELKKTPEQIILKKNQTIVVYDKIKNWTDKSFTKVPDLIVIDGGKGQLGMAIKACKDYKIAIPIISIAKKQEEFFIPGQKESIQLEPDNPARLLIQHIRDEAHRFAIEYNRKLRKKDYTGSSLEEISGISKAKANLLLKHFGSLQNIKQASEDEIANLVGTKIALLIKNNFL